MPIGFTLPFARATGSIGYLETTSDELSAAQQNLRSLLLTNWGERVMHHNFGCNLSEFLFELGSAKDVALKHRIADRINSQVARWLPYVKIAVLNVYFQGDAPGIPENGMGIRIKFHLVNRPDVSATIFEPIVQ